MAAPDEAAGHPEVSDEGVAVVQLKKEVLAPAADAQEPPPDEGCAKRIDARIAKEERRRGRVDFDGFDAAASDERSEVAANSFDFWKFGHTSSVTSGGGRGKGQGTGVCSPHRP